MSWDPKRIAHPDWFLDREVERVRLTALLEARDNVLVYGPRRLGKTSLIRRVAHDLPEKTFLFVDCPFAADEPALAQAILDGLKGTPVARMRRFLDTARQALQDLRLGIEIKGDGIAFHISRNDGHDRSLQDALSFLDRLARASKTHFVLVLDEFQTVIEMDGGSTTIGRLRSHAQDQHHVSYLLSGSRSGVLLGLTRRRDPFWRQLTEMYVGPIDTPTAIDDVERIIGTTVSTSTRSFLLENLEGNTQRLAEVLAILHSGDDFSIGAARDAFEAIIGRHTDTFERRFEECTPNQRRVLVALAKDRPDHVTGAEFITRNVLKSASHVQKAVRSLQKAEILSDDNRFEDPLFRAYLVKGAGGP